MPQNSTPPNSRHQNFYHNQQSFTFAAYPGFVPNQFYGQACNSKGEIVARTPRPCPTPDSVFFELTNQIKEKLDAHRYDVGGEKLIGTVRKTAKFPATYMGRLSFEPRGEREEGLVITYVESETEKEAYQRLDEAAALFAGKDGFTVKRINRDGTPV